MGATVLDEDMDWLKEMNALKEAQQQTDTQLAATLGISKGFLSDIRSKRRPLSPALKLAIIDRMGHKITKAVLISILPDDLQKKVMEIESKRLAESLR